MKKSGFVVVGVSALATAALGQPAQRVTGPVAEYWVSAQTMSGFGAMGAGPPAQGGRGGLGAMMGMGRGASQAQKLLTLQLGSSRRPPGEPSAEHLPPAGLKAGQSLPLLTPRATPAQPVAPGPQLPNQYERPRGRMLIFWGCGERAPAGQPVVIDFARMTDAQGAAAAAQAMGRGLSFTPMQPPSTARHATYGEWPNERARTSVPSEGSLVGDHVVRGDYSPEIRFALAQGQDFLAPLNVTSNAKTAAGAVQLGWNAVPGALAYYASAMGGDGETMVVWSSSAVQVSAMALPDYISPGDVARLVSARALMSPQTTTCAVPKEVVDAAPSAFFQLAAYGGEANFSYPPRPENRATPWNIDWTVKVRYRSQTGGLLGMAMPGVGAEAAPAAPGQPPPTQPQPRGRRPGAGDILRGLGLPSVPGLP